MGETAGFGAVSLLPSPLVSLLNISLHPPSPPPLFPLQGSLLKISGLNLTSTTVKTAKLCIRSGAPCHTPANFFASSPVQYDLEESPQHK